VSSDRHVSWQIQEKSIRDLALGHGDAEAIEIFSDWNRSGREAKTYLRTDYKRLLVEIESDQVSVVYGYSLSRLARSLKEYAAFAELCRDHHVPIRLAKEGEFDYSSPHGRAIVGVLAVFAQMEAELAQERARDTNAARRARGDVLGGRLYGSADGEDVDAVIRAFTEAGSLNGAAKKLNTQVLKTRNGNGTIWSGSTVKSILRRTRPDLLPLRDVKGAKSMGPYLLFRLLRCHCGETMTGIRPAVARGKSYALYRCRRASVTPAHTRPYSVPEHVVLDWVKEEAGRLRTPERVQLAEENAGARADLESRRLRVLDLYEAGHVDAADRDRRLASVAEEIARIASQERLVEVPELDWNWPPERINAVLRALWDFVQLGEDMRPDRAHWLLPEWRATGVEPSGAD
jgi:DNA invertase Pin-like site-specific DNA recombinase